MILTDIDALRVLGILVQRAVICAHDFLQAGEWLVQPSLRQWDIHRYLQGDRDADLDGNCYIQTDRQICSCRQCDARWSIDNKSSGVNDNVRIGNGNTIGQDDIRILLDREYEIER